MTGERTDWRKILSELGTAGLSPVAVADAVGISRSTPYRWLDGSEPLHSHGQAVLALHLKTVLRKAVINGVEVTVEVPVVHKPK